MRIARSLCGLALLAGVLVLGLNAANAQGSDAARQACTPDALRLCSDVIPDVAKVTACMKAKRAQLSEACRVAMSNGGGDDKGEGKGESKGKHYARHHGKHYYHHTRHCHHGHHCS